MNRLRLRVGFGVLAAIALGVAIWSMDRLSWAVDVVIAAIAVIAFAYYFERNDPPAASDRQAIPPATDAAITSATSDVL